MSVEEPSTNPYQSSPLLPTSVDRNLLSWRIIWRLIAIVVFCTFIGGLLGASAGLFLAILFPSYYAGVFELRRTGSADAVPLGVGLGCRRESVAVRWLALPSTPSASGTPLARQEIQAD